MVNFVNPGLEVTGSLISVLDGDFLFATFLFLGIGFVGLRAS